METLNPAPTAVIENCSRCKKPPNLCFCSEITPVQNERFVMILQHPQEPDKYLGTARLAQLGLKNSALLVGLSWPNLAKALQKAGYEGEPIAHEWAVLYLGAKIARPPGKMQPRIHAYVKYKNQMSLDTEGEMQALCDSVKGIIILDGTWSQAKALWWRNAWLSKLKRLAVTPRTHSLYGNLRKEPRRECLSTIESIAEVLEALREPTENSAALRAIFGKLIEKYKRK